MNILTKLTGFIVAFIIPSMAFGYVSTFEPRFSVSEEYNDNIYLSKENTEEDFITLVSPGFAYDIRWQKTNVSLDYELGYSYYRHNSENDDFRHDADILAGYDVSRNTRLQFSDSFIKTEEPFTDSTQDSGRRTRETYISNSSGAGLIHRFGERRSFSADYSYDFLKNDDDTVEDNSSHNASVNLLYYFSPHIGLITDAEYTNGEYDLSPGFEEWIISTRLVNELSRFLQIFGEYSHTFMNQEEGSVTGDYQVYHPSVGVAYTFDDEGSMSLALGYFVQDIERQANNSGLTIEGIIDKDWRFRRGLINLQAVSGYEDSYLNSENLGFNVYGESSARGEYNLNRDLNIWIEASFRNDDYVNPPPGQPERHDKTVTSGTGLSWQPKRWLEVTSEYSYRSLNSNISTYDYKENRVILAINISEQFN